MATLLLVVIYICYIGLGIPDSLFGTAWPAIYREFALPISAASLVTVLTSFCTMISSFISARLVNRFGTAAVTVISTAATAAGLLAYSFSGNILYMCIASVPLGFGAGAIDSALNNYVALHYSANHMSFLHCFYGVGVSVSPYVMSLFIESSGGWRVGYRTVFFVQLTITLITVLALPVWKRTGHISPAGQKDKPRTLSVWQTVKTPYVKTACLAFITSCSIEAVCTSYGSSFLVETKGFSIEKAAFFITFYYVGLAAGRFVSGLLASRLTSWQIIIAGMAVSAFAVVLTALPLPPFFAVAGLFLTGFGIGPVFPNLTHLTPINFGRDISGSVIGVQMGAAYIGIMLTPPIFGISAQYLSTDIFPFFTAILCAGMAASVIHLKKMKPALAEE